MNPQGGWQYSCVVEQQVSTHCHPFGQVFEVVQVGKALQDALAPQKQQPFTLM
ncbi:MAG TPA: hypothetical protein VEM41_10060 [Actinomycetota bacterium]|nr:hypothetical protein [Actinomycetota bacterium]